MTYTPYLVPISVKGIVIEKGKIWLRKNERNEWELPGGKIDPGEQPEQTIKRELQEELGFETEVSALIQAYMYTINVSLDENRGVLVLTYLCNLVSKTGDFEYVGEAGYAEFNAFELREAKSLHMPTFYKESIEKAARL